MKNYVLIAILLLGFSAMAQKVSIKRVELAGEKIIVHYDLEDSNPNNEYQINLYSSQSNFNTALSKVTGDVGNEVKPGLDRKIVWSMREEIGPYKGKLSLEIRGKMFVPVAKFNNITTATKWKRGKSHTVTWKAGNTNPINIELLNGGQRVTSELNQPNSGSHTFFISKSLSKGKDYFVRITDTKNTQDVASSQHFTIAPKLPLLVKLAPIVVIGGVVAALAGGGGGSETPTSNDLPEAPDPN